MVELIVCDIDGTLLQNGEKKVSPLVFEQIRRLQKKGIKFCPASGRQYNSLRWLFAPIADKIYYICDNGAVLYAPDNGDEISKRLLSKSVLPREKAESFCDYIYSQDNLEVVVSGANTEYIIPKKFDLSEHMVSIGYNVVKVNSLDQIHEDILKVTAFCDDGVESYSEELSSFCGKDYQVAMSGRRWLDVTLSDKGYGVRNICRILNIPLENVMAIGDNYNDLKMLNIVGHPVVMENAAEDIKQRFSTHCRVVEEILKEL